MAATGNQPICVDNLAALIRDGKLSSTSVYEFNLHADIPAASGQWAETWPGLTVSGDTGPLTVDQTGIVFRDPGFYVIDFSGVTCTAGPTFSSGLMTVYLSTTTRTGSVVFCEMRNQNPTAMKTNYGSVTGLLNLIGGALVLMPANRKLYFGRQIQQHAVTVDGTAKIIKI